MRSIHQAGRAIFACGALCALLSGCRHTITAPNAAPNITPGDNRQAMIQWHQQHDKRPPTLVNGR